VMRSSFLTTLEAFTLEPLGGDGRGFRACLGYPPSFAFHGRRRGCGFDPNRTPNGTGLTNMHDRIAAVGGTLVVHSRPSRGTRLHATIPQPWPSATAGPRPPAYQAASPADLGGLSA
jgi:hypothetical protein